MVALSISSSEQASLNSSVGVLQLSTLCSSAPHGQLFPHHCINLYYMTKSRAIWSRFAVVSRPTPFLSRQQSSQLRMRLQVRPECATSPLDSRNVFVPLIPRYYQVACITRIGAASSHQALSDRRDPQYVTFSIAEDHEQCLVVRRARQTVGSRQNEALRRDEPECG